MPEQRQPDRRTKSPVVFVVTDVVAVDDEATTTIERVAHADRHGWPQPGIVVVEGEGDVVGAAGVEGQRQRPTVTSGGVVSRERKTQLLAIAIRRVIRAELPRKYRRKWIISARFAPRLHRRNIGRCTIEDGRIGFPPFGGIEIRHL